MSEQEYPYDGDEFDVLGADRTPQGVHRAPVPRWRQLLPFLVVIVLAPLLAFAGVRALSGGDDGDQAATPTPTVTEEVTEDDGEDENGEADENGEDEGEQNGEEDPTEEETDVEDANLDRTVPIYVLNGTSTAGVAGTAADVLTEDGWANVSASDYNRAQPTNSEIYYNNAELAEEAESVAAALGIEPLYENASAASSGIVIVLRPDFDLP